MFRCPAGLLIVGLLLGGCGPFGDSIVRGRLMDHRLHREILPSLLDSYRLKMRNTTPPPGAVPAPDGIDRG